MSKFGHLKALRASKDTTARYSFYNIDGEPTLIVSPATEDNPGYFNVVLKRASKLAKRLRGRASVSKEVLDKNRREDLELFPNYIVKDWENVFDSENVPVPFSREACADFLEAIPPWMFDELRVFVGNPVNFMKDDDLDEVEVGDLSKK